MSAMARRIQTLLDTLDAQRLALLHGDYTALEGLGQRLEKDVDALRPDDLRAEDLHRLHAASRRNESLLEAAKEGVAQARSLMQMSDRAELSTYGRDGQRSSVVSRGKTLSRR